MESAPGVPRTRNGPDLVPLQDLDPMDDADSGQSIGAGAKAGEPAPGRAQPSEGRSGALAVDVVCDTPLWHTLGPDLEARVAETARAAMRFSGRAPAGSAQMTVLLTSNARIAALNAAFRGRKGPTNVLSFPFGDKAPFETGREGPDELGDVALAFETLKAEAEARAIPLIDHMRHLVVHGTLHLLGFDHEEEKEAEAMEAVERRILASLGVPDPYADDDERATGGADARGPLACKETKGP